MADQNTITRFFSGTLSRRAMLTCVIPLIIAILLVGLFISGLMYQEPYDWRYIVISRFLSPEDNPGWSSFAAIGMAIAGFVMITFLGYYQKHLGKICRGSTGVGTFFMLFGIVGLIGVGTIGQFDLGIEKLHEYLAAAGFLGVVLAAIFYGCPILKDHAKGAKQFNMRMFWAGMIPLLVGVAGLAISALYNELNDLSYASNPSIEDFEAYHFPAWISFAFWEWILFAGVAIYIVSLAFLVPETVIPFEKRK